MIRTIVIWLALSGAALAVETTDGTGAVLRGLDKISGDVEDFEIGSGAGVTYGRLTVNLQECRFPVANPAGDAFAFLTILAEGLEEPVFRGWMLASSPALNALDHPRYDVWLLRCTTP